MKNLSQYAKVLLKYVNFYYYASGGEMNTPLVTVIMPVYNVAPYLPTALDCLVNQTYTNLQILCIDDGSTDASAAILDQYAKQDPRITVFHTKNQGVALARNLGMQHMKGTYLCFVDPDDQWDLTLIEHMVVVAEEHHDDLVIAHAKQMPVENTIHLLYRKSNTKIDYSQLHHYDSNTQFRTVWNTLNNGIGLSTVWGKLFRVDYIKTIQPNFPHDVQTGTDALFMSNTYIHLRRITYIADTTYYHTPHTTGIGERYDNQFIQERFYVLSKTVKDYKLWDPQFAAMYASNSCILLYIFFRRQRLNHVPWKSQLQNMKIIMHSAQWKFMLAQAQPRSARHAVELAILRTQCIPLIFASCYAIFLKKAVKKVNNLVAHVIAHCCNHEQ